MSETDGRSWQEREEALLRRCREVWDAKWEPTDGTRCYGWPLVLGHVSPDLRVEVQQVLAPLVTTTVYYEGKSIATRSGAIEHLGELVAGAVDTAAARSVIEAQNMQKAADRATEHAQLCRTVAKALAASRLVGRTNE